jgi:biopolymer transport protein ExbD
MHFQRRLAPRATADLVPMIDVVFQLVVFFMVSSTFVLTPGINLDLPEASSAEPVVMNQTVVSVVSADRVFLNDERMTFDELDAALAEISATDDQPRSLVIEANADVPYATMIRALDVLRNNGFRGANLRTRAPEDGNGGGTER